MMAALDEDHDDELTVKEITQRLLQALETHRVQQEEYVGVRRPAGVTSAEGYRSCCHGLRRLTGR